MPQVFFVFGFHLKTDGISSLRSLIREGEPVKRSALASPFLFSFSKPKQALLAFRK
jgi:hypothetical protein